MCRRGGGGAAAGERKRVSRKRWDGGATKEWKGTALWMPGYMLCLKATGGGGRREGGRTVLGSQYPRIRTSTTRRGASLVLPSLRPAQSGGRRQRRMDDAGETGACNWRFQVQKLLFVFISRHDKTMSVRNACVQVPITEKKAPHLIPSSYLC